MVHDPQLGRVVATGSVINLPAVSIVAAITAVQVVGIRESTRVDSTLVAIKVSAVPFVIAVRAHYTYGRRLSVLAGLRTADEKASLVPAKEEAETA